MAGAEHSEARPGSSRPQRLINRQNLRLENDLKDKPPYAILSHTWSEDEVTFDDITKRNGRPKVGWTKIRGSCRQAGRDGLGYVWVDTCCIDKSSSAELDEAINSMFDWYRGADVCYVLLSDVPGGVSLADANLEGIEGALTTSVLQAKKTKICDCVKGSRWFTRGWTLQELLAPKRTLFFAKDWTLLGALEDLVDMIAGITTIPGPVLRNQRPVRDCSIAQRLSWSSRRNTTKPEDLAYCLLGILGIRMPLLYGEGEQAFLRLQTEIVKQQSQDLSIFAWPHVEADRATALFAKTPSDFARCGDIILDKTSPVDCELWAVSTGIKGVVQLVNAPQCFEEECPVLVSLNCYRDSMPLEILGLRLVICSEQSSSDTYHVHPVKSQDPYGWKRSRLGSIGFFDFPLTRRTLTILREAADEWRYYRPPPVGTSQPPDIGNLYVQRYPSPQHLLSFIGPREYPRYSFPTTFSALTADMVGTSHGRHLDSDKEQIVNQVLEIIRQESQKSDISEHSKAHETLTEHPALTFLQSRLAAVPGAGRFLLQLLPSDSQLESRQQDYGSYCACLYSSSPGRCDCLRGCAKRPFCCSQPECADPQAMDFRSVLRGKSFDDPVVFFQHMRNAHNKFVRCNNAYRLPCFDGSCSECDAVRRTNPDLSDSSSLERHGADPGAGANMPQLSVEKSADCNNQTGSNQDNDFQLSDQHGTQDPGCGRKPGDVSDTSLHVPKSAFMLASMIADGGHKDHG